MKTLLIVYHSQTGNTAQFAQAAYLCRGAVTAAYLAQCEELGLTLAAGLAFGIF